MLSCTLCNNRILNTKLNDYCRSVMNDSIKRITDKYNLERNKINNEQRNIIIQKPNYGANNNPFIFGLFAFLSISFSTIAFYIYKKNK